MDASQETKIMALLAAIQGEASGVSDIRDLDPMAKLMLSAILSETQSIQDSLEKIDERVLERYYEDFIPRSLFGAMPAITIVEAVLKNQNLGESVTIESNTSFTYKTQYSKTPLNYVPLFRTTVLPFSVACSLTRAEYHFLNEAVRIEPKEKPNVIWLGIQSPGEIESMSNVSLLFKGAGGISPERITIGDSGRELEMAPMERMEDIGMLEPFDAQQMSGRFFSVLQSWKEWLLGLSEGTLVYITDTVRDRDLFRTRDYPSVFKFCLTEEELGKIPQKLLWLKVEFPKNYRVPEDCTVSFNFFPVVNVDMNQVILTQASPIAKLQKNDESFFLDILQTSNLDRKQGYSSEMEEFIVRDFDAACYHDGDLYRDVRSLYHHFVEDYYAFLDYNGIKDGELIRKLRETINKIGKGVGMQNAKYKYDSGTYAMKNLKYSGNAMTTKISYLTTRGEAGNEPEAGQSLENRRVPALDKTLKVVVPAGCGRDKASADERYELLRYYSMTQDRLYTKMDIDAFLRKEIIHAFGPEEFKRIAIRISVEGAGGERTLRRGVYIDILFKDTKNYEKAEQESFAEKMKYKICTKSCLSMPIIISLVNMEQ